MELFKLVGSIVVDNDQAKKSIKDIKDETEEVPGFFKRAGGAVGSFMGKVGKIAGAVGVFKLVDGAMNMIVGSFDSAISRVDTLNQFPKVLEMMGVSGEEAEASIDRLSEGIQGLPTTLDGIASSTQRMFTILGDIDLATESTLALNNAFLASGASQADANRGMEQYMQMLSSGQVDMQSWRTLQQTMPYALNETAEAFGFTGESATDDFYDALLAGEITMEDFNAKMIELSEANGGFAETALEGSKGIATSWQNIQTAVVTGVGDIIDAFDDWLASNGFGGIPEVLDRIKEKANAMFGKIVEWVPIVLDWMVNLFNTITESTAFEILKTVVTELFNFIIETIPAVIGSMWELFNTVLESTAFQSLFDIITSIFDAITGSTAFQSLIDLLVWVYEAGVDFVSVLGDMGIIETVIGWVGDLANVFLDLDFREIASALGELVDKWSPLIAGVMGAYGAYKLIINATTIWNGIVAIATGITGALAGAYTFLTTTLTLANLKTVIMTGATGAWNVIAGIGTTVTTALAGAFAFLTSPIGLAVVAIGIIIGVGVLLWKNWDTVKEKASELGAKISEIWENIKNSISNAWEGIKTSVSEGVSNIWNSITTTFSDLPEKMASIGSDMIKGLWNGINSVKDWILGKISGFVDGITGGIKSFFGIKSPSKLMADEVGKWIPAGIAVGIEDNSDLPLDALNKVIGVEGFDMRSTVKKADDTDSGVGGAGREVNQTVNINSPTSLNAVETARQMRKVNREFALEN